MWQWVHSTHIHSTADTKPFTLTYTLHVHPIYPSTPQNMYTPYHIHPISSKDTPTPYITHTKHTTSILHHSLPYNPYAPCTPNHTIDPMQTPHSPHPQPTARRPVPVHDPEGDRSTTHGQVQRAGLQAMSSYHTPHGHICRGCGN